MKRPSPSMAVALVALFVALGGTATAAKVLISNSSQIKAGVVKRSDIAKSAIDSARVADGTLQSADLSEAARNGLAGGAPVVHALRLRGPENIPREGGDITTLKNIPAGSYLLLAKTTLTNVATANDFPFGAGESASGRCDLLAESADDQSRSLITGPGANAPGTLNMQLIYTFPATGEAKIRCSADTQFRASDTSIIAVPLKVTEAQRNDG